MSNEEIKLQKYRFAITSKSGVNIDQHFGHATEYYIYDYNNGKIKFLEKRETKKYCNGNEDCEDNYSKIEKIIKTIGDCNVLLTVRIGLSPRTELEKENIKIILMYEPIEEGIRKAVKNLKG